MAEVLISEAAEEDVVASLKWYAERSRHGAERFEAELANALQVIAEAPDRYPLCDEVHHFFLLKRYPFQLIYRQVSSNRLLVVAVAHTSRQPGWWKRR